LTKGIRGDKLFASKVSQDIELILSERTITKNDGTIRFGSWSQGFAAFLRAANPAEESGF
jgi:hypothetical protein